MATESVVTNGIEYLLEPTLVPRDPRRTISAASNLREPIGSGIAAIGELLWRANANEELAPPRGTVHDIGLLLKMLAELDRALAEREVNAYQCLLEPAAYAQLGGDASSLSKGH